MATTIRIMQVDLEVLMRLKCNWRMTLTMLSLALVIQLTQESLALTRWLDLSCITSQTTIWTLTEVVKCFILSMI